MQRLAAAVLAAAFCCVGLAQPPAPPPPPGAPAAQEQGGGVLFRATRDDATVFLYGTIHVGEAGFYPLPPTVLRPLQRSQALLVEVDVLSVDLPSQFRLYGLLPEGTPPASIDPQYRGAVDSALRQLKIDPAVASRFKPDVLAATLAVAEVSRLGLTGEWAVEAFLIGFARALNVPVVELEGLQAQLTLNDGLPAQARQQLLDQAVQSLVSGEGLESVGRVVRGWRQRDLDALATIRTEAGLRPEGQRMIKQIETRNAAMADAIVSRINGQSRLFVAVGILHFTGPRSLQALLQQRGFRVERLY